MSTEHSSGRAASRDAGDTGSERRAELLAIAADLFAARGVRATTVREIAESAGILPGSLYHHFDSKNAMVDEILREFLDHQRRSYDEVLREAADARTTIAELVRRSFRGMHRYRAAVAIFQNEANHLAGIERFDHLRQASRDFERVWKRVLADGRRTGAFRADLNITLAYRFIRDGVWTAVHWYNPRGRLTINAIAEQYIAILCEGIAAPERQ
ncbi:AcrR family transcriptional regulator [Saccharopolyspora lacisalsi]|uniref:AcrR family transcriptional regulator n=1 Tax=Halosaccharopolyspora lacisalsi TaxID=1000566 RepID=A0A839E593_9PSEU|nr:TetR/AcrR family transcriptional regulator [Halosaccharopolyspora lacisalsi]MBA8826501.1 AcrR family transcriptional regulator [Halosaccharopolyspora lacisalsi]